MLHRCPIWFDEPTCRLSSRRGTGVTVELFGFNDLQADHITYRPGDTAAAHYHVGARHIWFVSEGRGTFHVDDETFEVEAGDVATAGDGEVHWFENPHEE